MPNDPPASDWPFQNAWCDECDKVLMEEGEWNERSEGFAGIIAICEGCFEEIKHPISEYFSLWLNDSSGENFERIISTKIQQTRDTWSEVNIGQPESFEIDDNPLDVEELREEIQTFSAEITDENFKLWSCISILTDDEKWSFI